MQYSCRCCISLKSQPCLAAAQRTVLCSPCIMCPAGYYPPQHKQAGLQIQRNTNRNTARNSGEIGIQQIQSSMGSMNTLSHYVVLTSLRLGGYVVFGGFEKSSRDTLFMRESKTIPLLTMQALSRTYSFILLHPEGSKDSLFFTDKNRFLTKILSRLQHGHESWHDENFGGRESIKSSSYPSQTVQTPAPLPHCILQWWH